MPKKVSQVCCWASKVKRDDLEFATKIPPLYFLDESKGSKTKHLIVLLYKKIGEFTFKVPKWLLTSLSPPPALAGQHPINHSHNYAESPFPLFFNSAKSMGLKKEIGEGGGQKGSTLFLFQTYVRNGVGDRRGKGFYASVSVVVHRRKKTFLRQG